jgi:octopine/nopaline transport system permease protein
MGYEGFFGLPSFLAGALAVGIISGAYQAEVFRGAYLAISKGELEAASAIGMHRGLRFRRIIIPQVLRLAIPGLGNVWQLSLKDSALISVTGLAELMRTSQVAAGSTRQYFLFFIVGGILYLILTSLSDRVFNGAERRANRSMPTAAMGKA